ncbi:magnesium protoporphyrin IX methyltransferase [Jannaschia donghaensis]|uniref:Magnesium protoporphyrin IX methyltransferase n=1 Tax=Jannaschia donghaensis TaxID=420998 RepID=A0A0M6YFG9_9RHOB|nr:magnesium protoporphyrin IX methyltransferase [Jannaschia donghaensis]CTQ48017.1 Magnesium-protoporphyrin O-methyltransferase [Jannaschia donghaensis]
MTYDATLSRVETYFDRTATKTWEALTSDAPVSGIRATVRRGRDQMRAILLSQMPRDLTGLRILDAGCGTGALAVKMASRGAQVVAIDISPQLIDIARRRAPDGSTIDWRAGDMLDAGLGTFDHVTAMDSLIYYSEADLAAALDALAIRTRGSILFTVAPRTPLLMAMWNAGKLFPKADRSPTMVPQSAARLSRRMDATLTPVTRVNSGFYISNAIAARG